ncbi:MAG TPA: TonB-dependent receptor [Methylophilus sp.]|nr:TonB-dependent receptor [Methylophilus sp.]HQQ33072.1 TonB-dependent receptor [Methylophilus sp.]
MLLQAQTQAADLNTSLPGEQDNTYMAPVNVDIPRMPLAGALKKLGAASGLDIAFDDALVLGKTAPAIKGTMSRKEALQRLLSNSGLAGKIEGTQVIIKKAPPGNLQKSENIQLQTVNVRAKRFHEIGPLPGLGLTKEEIPGNVQSITAKEIKEAHSLSLTDLLNKKLQSVTVNDYQGNPFQMDVQYRGFTAGPQIGTPQGLSVFFDGIRVNEPFGDVVNWDMIPMNAIAGVDVFPGSNPIFGLNTLGGAFTLKTKDGFTHEGVDAEVLTGSFGRKQLQVEGGINNGTFALFGAGNFFLEDGWRENSPSKVNQLFTKGSYRGDKLDLSLSTLLVQTDLVGNGLLPSEEYARDRNSVFTSPDTTKNKLAQFQLSGSYFVNDNFTITGQVYRRKSKRHQIGADVMRDWDEDLLAQRIPQAGEQYTCLFNSSGANQYGTGSAANQYGLPDYIVLPFTNYDPSNPNQGGTTSWLYDPSNPSGSGFSALFEDLNNGTFNPANYASLINQPLSPEFLAAYQYNFKLWSNFAEQQNLNRGGLQTVPVQGSPSFFGEPAFSTDYGSSFAGNALDGGNTVSSLQDLGGVMGDQNNYFFTQDPTTGVITKNFVITLSPANAAACYAMQKDPAQQQFNITDPTGNAPFLTVDGGQYAQPGVVSVRDPSTGKDYFTPTALLNDNQIDQVVDGFSMQLNWNLDKHKLMVGVSIDAANAEYGNSQRLGLLDANRKGYLAPDQIHPMFTGAFVPLENNNFEGTSTTKSIYFSETWTPVETWNFNASGRYNFTQVKNKIAARRGIANFTIGDTVFQGFPSALGICPNADCTNVPTNFRIPELNNVLDSAETEKFSYYSFNPSLGATWQAQENLNLFANVAKGTRVPSVIELGCALDKTPVYTGGTTGDPSDPKQYQLKSIFENRSCTLPTTLSGDPFLPQIKSTSYDIGIRGNLTGLLGTDGLEWNLGAYQTDLKDDIYFVPAPGSAGAGFFDTIGKTRRRGLEAGLSGKKDKWGFSVNYSLTDATFQDTFYMTSRDNSSAKYVDLYGDGTIQVKPGNRMPGVPMHNLNATVSYDITPQWQVGLTAVAHSESFVRGNENNEHKKGVIRRTIEVTNQITGAKTLVETPPTNNPGKVPGFATFNFQTSYKFNKEWTANLLINNLFDKEYFSAGRLGINPFSPSINGAIGVSGYNHNSLDWLSTNFIAPGAPRGIWFSLNWQFAPDKKAEASGSMPTERNLSMPTDVPDYKLIENR